MSGEGVDQPTAVDVDLAIQGMTCASCANRIERKLGKIPGVEATVNYATEKARVHAPDGVVIRDLLGAVKAAGYSATLIERPEAKPVRRAPQGRVGDSTGTEMNHGAHHGNPLQQEAVAHDHTAMSGHDGARDHSAHGANTTASAENSVAHHSGGNAQVQSHDEMIGHDHTAMSGHDHGTVPEPAEVAQLRQRVLISAILTTPVVAMSMIPALQFTNWQWLTLALAAPVATWGAWPFHRAALRSARHGGVGMDTLVSLGVTAAFGWSLYALFFGGAGVPGMHMDMSLIGHPEGGASEIYLEVAAAVTTFILLGRFLEARAKRDAGAALRSLLELGAKDATLVEGDHEMLVPVSSLQAGDVVRVRPGATVPSDGFVIAGTAAIDSSMLTGESVPVEVKEQDRVVGGTIATAGTLLVRIDRVGADTELSHMARLVEDAQAKKARIQRLADRVSAIFVPTVIVLAIGALIGWLVSGATVEVALTAAVATLIIACPCALGLATPVALLVGTGRGSQLGILIQGPDVLEETRRVDTIVLDKTGTITTGKMTMHEVVAAGDENELLALAAAVEHGSEHPIAEAVVAGARDRGIEIPVASEFEAEAGFGVRALVSGAAAAVGRLSWLAASGIAIPEALREATARIEREGGTAVAVASGGKMLGVVAVADSPKATSALAISRFKQLGLSPVLLTGDNAGAASAVAAAVGISEVIAEATPGGKLDHVRALQSQGRVVAMVGDGVNDAAALAAADLGIAMGGGTDAAIAASDITVVSGDLLVVVDAIRLSRRTLGIIRGNLFWAFAYNVAAIPLAMAGLLNPMLAGAAMAFSSLFVVLNSLRLRAFRREPVTASS